MICRFKLVQIKAPGVYCPVGKQISIDSKVRKMMKILVLMGKKLDCVIQIDVQMKSQTLRLTWAAIKKKNLYTVKPVYTKP